MKNNLLFFIVLSINIILLIISYLFFHIYEFPDDEIINNINFEAVEVLKIVYVVLLIINFAFLIFKIMKSEILEIKNYIILFLIIFCVIKFIKMLWLTSGLIRE